MNEPPWKVMTIGLLVSTVAIGIWRAIDPKFNKVRLRIIEIIMTVAILTLILLFSFTLIHCNMDPFQPGRPGYDGGVDDASTDAPADSGDQKQ